MSDSLKEKNPYMLTNTASAKLFQEVTQSYSYYDSKRYCSICSAELTKSLFLSRVCENCLDKAEKFLLKKDLKFVH